MSSSVTPQPPADDRSTSSNTSGATGNTSGAADSVAAGDLLPPVEPPSAGFIIQLFVVPMVIVAAVVGLWMLIQWMADSGGQTPEELVRGLRSNNQARFQQAQRLSHMLQAEARYPEFKTNRQAAGALANLLSEMVEVGSDGESDVTMRLFLCRALGEFHVNEGLPALINAAEHDPERDVRRSAINSLAVLTGTLPTVEPKDDFDSPELLALLTKLADEDDELVRSETGFTLGVIAQTPSADPAYQEVLASLVDDFYPDARYNAAFGLARVGDLRALPALVEIFDPQAIEASLQLEKVASGKVSDRVLKTMRGVKRDGLLEKALHAIRSLRKQNEPASLAPAKQTLDTFLAEVDQVKEPTPVPERLIDEAKTVRRELDK